MNALVRLSRGAGWLALAGCSLVASPLALEAQRPKTQPVGTTARTDAVQAVGTAFRNALAQPSVQSAVKAELVRQVGAHRPLAAVGGHWVTPVDLSLVYAVPAVRSAMVAQLGGSGPSLIAAATANPGARLGLAFTQAELGKLLMGEMAKDIAASFAEGALQAKMTGMAVPVAIGIGIGLGLVVPAGLYIGGQTSVGDWLYDAFFGDSGWDDDTGWDPNAYDPEADPDGDGKPNYLDDDDDGDGVNDEDDAYPDDPNKSICGHCTGGPGGIFFTSRFSDQITDLVLANTSALAARRAATVSLGAVGSGSTAGVGVMFP
jgi:hypothetical protein